MGRIAVISLLGRTVSKPAGIQVRPAILQSETFTASALRQTPGKPTIKLRISDKLPGADKLLAGRVALPKLATSATREQSLTQLKGVGDTYPLISTKWKGKEYVLASADIHFNPILNQVIYNIIEPMITDDLKDLIGKTIELLHDRLEVDFTKLREKKEIYAYLDTIVDEI